MAINEQENKTLTRNKPVEQMTAAAQGQAAPAAAQQPAKGSLFSFHGGSFLGAPISRGLGSEYLTKLTEALAEVFKTADPSVEITQLPIDNVNDPALAFSVDVVALRYKSAPNAVAFHILVVEATGEKPTPIQDNIQNTPVEILRLTNDAFDTELLSKCRLRVMNAFPKAEKILFVDGCVVPRSFNPEDKHKIHQLALNAGLACSTELDLNTDGFQDINLSNAKNDTNLIINVTFGAQQMEDAVGMPMRSDVMLNFNSQRQQQNSRYGSLNSGDREARIAEAAGFMDVLWAPVAPQLMNAWIPQQNVATQKYASRLVLTNLASNFAQTPSAVLLNLAIAGAMREDNNWVQAFRPVQTSANEVDFRDIGALNIEANVQNDPSGIGQRINVKAENFTLTNLGEYIGALFQPGLMIALDVPECGPQTWYMNMFRLAAQGEKQAIAMVTNAANNLTNGNFSKYFKENDAMFIDTNNRIHLGYWTDRNGQRRDIRDFDLVAISNLCERNPQVIRDWSDTWTRSQFPLELRLSARKKMIYAMSGETAEFTGFAQRVTFSAKFMDALIAGVAEAGLHPRISTPLSSADFNNQRGVASFASAGLGHGVNGFAAVGGMGGNAPANFQAGSFSRFNGGNTL